MACTTDEDCNSNICTFGFCVSGDVDAASATHKDSNSKNTFQNKRELGAKCDGDLNSKASCALVEAFLRARFDIPKMVSVTANLAA